MQLSQVLNLGLVSWAFSTAMPFWACGFSALTIPSFRSDAQVNGKL